LPYGGNGTRYQGGDKLGIAQPFLTKVINQLEDEIGTPLFDKVGRQIKLNRFGEAFYEQTKKVLACMDNMFVEMDNMLDRLGRNITLLSNTEAYMPGLIVDFNKNNANYTLSFFYAPLSGIADALKTGEADFALTYPPDTPGNFQQHKNRNGFLRYRMGFTASRPSDYRKEGHSFYRFGW